MVMTKEEMKQYQKEYRERNKEKIAEQQKEWKEKNKEKIAEHNKIYNEKHKDKITEKKKEYYENNKDAINQRNKEYYEDNKDKITEQHKEWRENNKDKATKCSRIATWKSRGVISDDYESLYEYYLNVEFCELCDVELVEGLYGNNKKCLDHDHITGEFRNVLCCWCNTIRG